MPAKARRNRRRAAAILPAHLPLQAAPDPTSSSVPPTPAVLPVVGKSTIPDKKPRDRTILPSNSLVRQKVLAIVALRLEGLTAKEIGERLGLTEASIKQYMWLGGKNGWLKKHAIDPTDRLEHEIVHKVVRNLDEMLDSGDEGRRDKATLTTAEGMLFKRYAADAAQAPPLAVIGIRIEQAPGTAINVREGTTGGTARFVEGETLADEAPK